MMRQKERPLYQGGKQVLTSAGHHLVTLWSVPIPGGGSSLCGFLFVFLGRRHAPQIPQGCSGSWGEKLVLFSPGSQLPPCFLLCVNRMCNIKVYSHYRKQSIDELIFLIQPAGCTKKKHRYLPIHTLEESSLLHWSSGENLQGLMYKSRLADRLLYNLGAHTIVKIHPFPAGLAELRPMYV